MALQRALVVIALRTGGRGLDDPGRAAPRGSRADPHVRAAESRGGEDLKERAESWASATAGPNAAGGQSYRCADAGGCVRFPCARAIAGFSSLPDRAGDRVVVGCFVPRASHMFA